MLSLQQQQHGGAVAVGDVRLHAPQPAVLGGGGGGGGGDWLGFVGRADLEEPARNAPSPATFLLPPAPLDDRAAQPEPKPKPGQLAGAVDEERHLALAHQNYRSGKYREALEHGNVVYEKNPRRTDNLLLLGAIYYQIRNYDMCIAKNEEALAIDPHFAECYGNMANAWKEKGDIDLAIRYYLTAIQLRPNFCDAWSNLASAYTRKGRLNEAAQCCRQALAINPRLVDAHSNLGNLMKAQGFIQDAYSCYIEALRIDPHFAIAWSNLAGLFMEAGDLDKALMYYKEAVKLKPSFADAYLNQGNVYKALGMPQDAIMCYQRALQARPDYAMAYGNLATIYYEQGQLDMAIRCYNQAIVCDPQFVEAYNNMVKIIRRQIKMSVLPSVQPFHAIAYPIDPMLALEISRKYAAHCSLIASRFGLPPFVHPSPVPVKVEGKHCRLRVGYVSSDFGNHPLSHLMGSVFGMHDRDNIEVFCYALSQNDGTEWRQRIQSEAEHFVDVSAMTSDMIARLINQDKIQILINLNGYTKGARNEIFALQPAPIQVSYMGFPGTTGAAYIDYLVTDEFVSPSCYAHIYSEKLVHLPHCYFVNDYKQKNQDCLTPVCPHKRSDYGLPEDKFIFACFNQLYKMDPEIFDTWCNILKRVPNSALWLLRFPAAGETRVRSHAAARGVRPDQIIFTDVAMKNEHIRRSQLADLFLDTPLCNAHTTGTDILWAGLPMITLPLEKMATRVAGSLCVATGLGEEMIVSSMKEYEERAVELALNPAKLQSLTNKLKEVRMSCPLFDTARWVRNLERAYYKMWNLYCSGRHPEPFKVEEDDKEFPFDR
ncbi:hypothetical protein PVAP13_1KG257000 [Panicum virgatum]|uniref:protein O-GlcNAc transferase n=1 Tax=Panicum virgatum TaxID=38727 RepID=A0A8T0XEJ8_PANVG|nr:hypothetical protein PVAP13_1KG257000 [Panicum virgatum]